MSTSTRAYYVLLSAMMLALASHAGATGQSAPAVPQAKDAPTPSEARGTVVKTKGNIKDNRSSAEAAVITPTTGAQPVDGKLKGKVTTIPPRGMLNRTREANDPACASNTKDGRPASCPKGINEAGIK